MNSEIAAMDALCRDCLSRDAAGRRCAACGSPRVVAARGLFALTIAHVDCDAFYASVEKRDDPSLRDKPLIVGGGQRGVVTTACYLARSFGVRSAMSMAEARRRCPEAEIRAPRMAVYAAVSRAIAERLAALTPLVEPLSLDEAFLDLSGTEKLHGAPPAALLARLGEDIERTVGVTISIGLAPNKFLAKIASELDKPRGFAVIAVGEAERLLAPKPVGAIWGVGPAAAARLERDGYRRIADLQAEDAERLFRRYGAFGLRLHRLARGEDDRPVDPRRARKSISAETTFDVDTRAPSALEPQLWRLCERVADQLKARDLSAGGVVLKLKTASFRLFTRRAALESPSALADALWTRASRLLRDSLAASPSDRFRLIGVAAAPLIDGARRVGEVDLFDRGAERRAAAETAMDALRARFGAAVIGKGRGLAPEDGEA